MIRWILMYTLVEYIRSTSGGDSGAKAAAAAAATSSIPRQRSPIGLRRGRPSPRLVPQPDPVLRASTTARPHYRTCNSRRNNASVFAHASAAALAS